jgi:hypothetical protein
MKHKNGYYVTLAFLERRAFEAADYLWPVLSQNVMSLSLDVWGTFIVQAALKHLPLQLRALLLDQLRPQQHGLSQSRPGSFVVSIARPSQSRRGSTVLIDGSLLRSGSMRSEQARLPDRQVHSQGTRRASTVTGMVGRSLILLSSIDQCRYKLA